MARLGSVLAVLDFVTFGSVVSLRSFIRFGSNLSVYGIARLGSSSTDRRNPPDKNTIRGRGSLYRETHRNADEDTKKKRQIRNHFVANECRSMLHGILIAA